MKKKILFIMPSMFIGGAERSLLGLLDSIDYEKYDISLFLYRHEGEFLEYINPNVRILPAIDEYATFDVSIKSLVFSNKIKFGSLRLLSKILQRVHEIKHPDENGIWMHMQKISCSLQKSLPEIPGEYDAGIMFLGVPDTLVNKVKAKVKIAWNHTDYTILGADQQYDREIFNKLDYIVSVSNDSRRQFLNVYPEFEYKAIVIENILSKELIMKLAEESVSDMPAEEDIINLLSVGRYSYAKNFDNVPDICRRIIEKGIKVRWYIIGFGGDEQLIRKKIQENSMEDHVVLLGKRINPYPYIKKCDVYIQPSRYEGKAVTVLEAQILNKPVIIANYATAESQLKNGIDGLIVSQGNEKAAEEIFTVLNDKKRLNVLSENCKLNDYTNSSELKILTDIIEDY